MSPQGWRLCDRQRQFPLKSRRDSIPLPPAPRPREPPDRCRRIAAWAPVAPISPCPDPLSQRHNANPTPTPRTTRWALVKRWGCDPDMLGWSRSWDDLDAEHRCGLLLAGDFFNTPIHVFVPLSVAHHNPGLCPPLGEGCHNYDFLITPCRREPPPPRPLAMAGPRASAPDRD